jgi:asparagine synthase (glutamine-hydrolysing)
MGNAVEVRLPFLDHKLFEYARAIPAFAHSRNGIRKYLLREAVKPWVSPEVYRRKKQPFFAQAATRRPTGPLYIHLQDLLRSESFTSMPFFRRRSVIEMLDKLPQLDADHRSSLDPVVFAMASLAALRVSYRL